jgi:sulfonate transport system substrate-binding protein
MIPRRSLLALAPAAALAGFAASPRPAAAANGTVRIGYQKYGTLILLKAAGTLEASLAPLGFGVSWHEFLSGPPMLEAINAGAVDFGITGETPPVFAQAAGTPFVYVAADPPSPSGEGFVVPGSSTAKSVADLRGKRIVTTKGANANYLLVVGLNKAGLKPSDVKIVYLAPPDALAAFQSGSVDAWVAWDPFFATAELTGARLLEDGTGLVPNRQFFLAAKKFADASPAVVHALLKAVGETEVAVKADPAAAAAKIGPVTGIPVPILVRSLSRLGYGVGPITPDMMVDQQKIADTFFGLGLIKQKVTVTDAVWKG